MEGEIHSEGEMKMKKMSLFMLLAVVLVAGVARADLVARYEFEGSFADSSGNGHTGTPVGDAAIVNWAPMPQTGMLGLDGDEDWVDLGASSDFDLSEAFTITAWVNPDVLVDNNPIVNKYGSELISGYTPYRGYYFRVEPSGAIKTRVVKAPNDGTSVVSDPALGVVEVGTWTHVATTYEYVADGSSLIRLYLNGELVGGSDTAHGPIKINPERAAWIGAYQYNMDEYSRYFDGLMDDVRIYNNAMSAAEIRSMVVPEPMTMALLALGGLALYRRRRA